MAKFNFDTLEKKNAEVLANLVADPATTELRRVEILTKLIEAKENQNFFQTMFEEGLSLGECPSCGHQNHWAIPEDELNQMGYVTHEQDSRVPVTTNAESCTEFQEACKKKKVIA